MKKLKKILLFVIAVLGVALLGYHGAESFVAFKNPLLTDISFSLAIVVWTIMAIIIISDRVKKHALKWKLETIKNVMVISIAIVAYCIGSTVANFNDLLTEVLTMKQLIPMLCIPVFATIACTCFRKKE